MNKPTNATEMRELLLDYNRPRAVYTVRNLRR